MAAAAIMLATCCASDDVHRVKIVKITTEIQQAPQFQVAGVKNKNEDPRYWLELEAELEVETTAKSGFIPEITAKWFAVVYDSNKKTKNSKSSKEPVRLLGDVRFKNIRTKDKKTFISAYIDPDTLEQLTGKNRPSENDIESVALLIDGKAVYKEHGHARGLMKVTTKTKIKWWEKWDKRSLNDTIMPKAGRHSRCSG